MITVITLLALGVSIAYYLFSRFRFQTHAIRFIHHATWYQKWETLCRFLFLIQLGLINQPCNCWKLRATRLTRPKMIAAVGFAAPPGDRNRFSSIRCVIIQWNLSMVESQETKNVSTIDRFPIIVVFNMHHYHWSKNSGLTVQLWVLPPVGRCGVI